MAYMKKGYSGKRNPIKSKKAAVPEATRKAIQKAVRPLQPELKRVATFYDEIGQNTLTQGSSVDLINVQQGNGAYQRGGQEIRVKGFHIKGVLNNNATTPNYIRMVLAWVPGAQDTTFASTYWFKDANAAGGAGTISTVSGANILYTPLNDVLIQPVWDKTIKLGGSADPTCTTLFSKYIKMDKLIQYNANTTGVGAMNKQLTLVVFSAEAGDDTGLGQTVELSFVGRTFFTDV